MTALLVAYGLALAVTAIAAVTDARRGIIPNVLTLPTLVLSIAGHGVLYGWRGLLVSAGGALFCSIPPLLMFRKGAMGGGDVKLFAALGALFGPVVGIEVQFFALCAAMVFACATLAWRGKLLATFVRAAVLVLGPLLPKRLRARAAPELMATVRLGPAIFAGTLLAVALRHPFV
jgi:prepilin peptidase CpaA